MYNNSGKFDLDDEFYVYDSNAYRLVGNGESVDVNTPIKYYYTASNSFVEDEGKYMPAVTLENTCVVYTGTEGESDCISVGAGKMKLKTAKYYNIVSKANSEDSTLVKTLGVNLYGIEDTRIWQIAKDDGDNPVKFGFGLASNLGRPIIFGIKDGAGNDSSNYLETVIAIQDKIAPSVSKVYATTYNKDDYGNYYNQIKYYKVSNLVDIKDTCEDNKYFDENQQPVSCSSFGVGEENEDYKDKQFFVQVYEYGELAESVDLGTNYLTKNHLRIEFDEPIYKVKCTYYLYDVNNEIGEEYDCSFNNTEYNYRENRTTFDLVYEADGEYYLNYSIEVYDFSNNKKVVNSLFIDRETPKIEFDDGSTRSDDMIEVDYFDSNVSGESKYNQDYLSSGFRNDAYAIDRINVRINNIGASMQITNTLSYEVVYKKYNYDLTFKNYIYSNGSFETVPNGTPKSSGTTYYILISKPADYILKGNSGTCIDDTYCYIEDSYSYYPDLLENEAYWTILDDGEVIKNNEIGVYKIEYRVRDYSGNISEIIIKTVYIVDNTAPVLKINGVESSQKYGYHKSVEIKVENEKQLSFYEYTCREASNMTCILPTEIFAKESSTVVVNEEINENYNAPGIYKIYYQDLGSYIESAVCESDECSSTVKIMTLKYNFVEYQFIIDIIPPEFYVSANKDANTNKLYYEVSLTQEEYVYCVKGDRHGNGLTFSSQNISCEEYLVGTPKTEVINNGETVKYYIYNANNEIIYEKTFAKVGAQKFFYNIYYKKDGDAFIEYPMGADYDDENVYIVKSMKMYFREDGQYLIKAVDRAGNTASRVGDTNEASKGYSSFTIDNTAPSYNKLQTAPTGINYWYSVPSVVINSQNIDKVKNVTLQSGKNVYNVFTSNLNNNFFYAFSTRNEAIDYLSTIYNNHISAQTDNTCGTLNVGFNYTYYDPSTKEMKTSCFIGTDGLTNKQKAINTVMTVFGSLIFPTFSENVLFGDSTISQLACDETVSENCAKYKDMYSYVYLKIEGENKSIVEACEESAGVQCVKVNVKSVKNSILGNKATFKLGADNVRDPDSSSVVVYSKSTTGSTIKSTPYTVSQTISLNNNTYYIFEEVDKNLNYRNYSNNVGVVHHSKL